MGATADNGGEHVVPDPYPAIMGNYLYKEWEDAVAKHDYKYNHEPLMTTFKSIELELNYTVCYANLGDEPRCWCSPFESISVQVIFKRNLVVMRNSEAVAPDADSIGVIKATDAAFKGRFSVISDCSPAKWGKEENKNVFLQTCKQFTDYFNADPRPFEPKLSVAALKRCVEKAEKHSVEVPAAVTVALQKIEAMKDEAAAKIKADAKQAKKERDAAKAKRMPPKPLSKQGRGAQLELLQMLRSLESRAVQMKKKKKTSFRTTKISFRKKKKEKKKEKQKEKNLRMKIINHSKP